jgi:hypothetical protein
MLPHFLGYTQIITYCAVCHMIQPINKTNDKNTCNCKNRNIFYCDEIIKPIINKKRQKYLRTLKLKNILK